MQAMVARVLLPLVLGIGCAAGASSGKHPAAVGPGPQQAAAVAWPPLPAAFVSGRPATPEDVLAGRAVFATQAGGTVEASALPLDIPQYAYCAPDGALTPGIIVQAERARGMEVVGFRPLSGAPPAVTLLTSCQLLGQATPPGSLAGTSAAASP